MAETARTEMAADTPHVVIVSDVDLGRIDAPMVHTCAVARFLAEAGVRVDLVARGPDPGLPGVRYHAAAEGPVGRGARLAGVNRTALRVLRANRATLDALYVRKDWGSLPAMLEARRLGLRVVTEVNDLPYGRHFPREEGAYAWLADHAKRGFGRAIWRTSTHVVAVTDGLKSLIAAEYGVAPTKITVLPNGVDAAAIVPLDRDEAVARAGLPESRVFVVFIGSLEWRVDWQTMMRAFAAAAASRPALTLVLVGDGPDADAVDSLADELGIADRVIRTGFVAERARVNDVMGAARVCLVPLRQEARGTIGASPLKLTEYFAAGRAVVATDVPGVHEMIERSGAGILVPPGDVDVLASAVGGLADDAEAAERMAAAGRAAAEQTYSWSAIAERLAQLLLDRGADC
jgi:glycosyltransferase involved in cell wall biosynthesis